MLFCQLKFIDFARVFYKTLDKAGTYSRININSTSVRRNEDAMKNNCPVQKNSFINLKNHHKKVQRVPGFFFALFL